MSPYNKQGRAVSDTMRVKAFAKFLAAQPKRPAYQTETYRGFEISGRPGASWFVANDPRIFKSIKAARAAVDVCLALRAELAKEDQ